MVYDHGGNDEQAPLFRVTVTFTDVKGKTQMEMIMALATAEAAEQTKKFIKAAGGNGTWDRLAEFLETDATGKENFVINRSFDVPMATMFKMWTDPEHFSKWLAPTGFNMKFIRKDIKSGGSTFYYMSNDAGMKMYGKANYLEVRNPDLIKYTQVFCDENEKISRHPMAPTWPETMLTTVNLTSEGPEQTRVTITWEVYGNYTPEELETFVKGKAGMTMGWTGSFDKLEAYLENL
jgi:uncharacterized protein YndB with AHSA1/START domain